MKKFVMLFFVLFNIKVMAETVSLKVKDVLDLATYNTVLDESSTHSTDRLFSFSLGDNGGSWFGNKNGDYVIRWKIFCHRVEEDSYLIKYRKELAYKGDVLTVLSKGHKAVAAGESFEWTDHYWHGSDLVVRQKQEVSCR